MSLLCPNLLSKCALISSWVFTCRGPQEVYTDCRPSMTPESGEAAIRQLHAEDKGTLQQRAGTDVQQCRRGIPPLTCCTWPSPHQGSYSRTCTGSKAQKHCRLQVGYGTGSLCCLQLVPGPDSACIPHKASQHTLDHTQRATPGAEALPEPKIRRCAHHGLVSSILVPGGSFLHFWQPALSH